jgi:hypothetical protein
MRGEPTPSRHLYCDRFKTIYISNLQSQLYLKQRPPRDAYSGFSHTLSGNQRRWSGGGPPRSKSTPLERRRPRRHPPEDLLGSWMLGVGCWLFNSVLPPDSCLSAVALAKEELLLPLQVSSFRFQLSHCLCPLPRSATTYGNSIALSPLFVGSKPTRSVLRRPES